MTHWTKTIQIKDLLDDDTSSEALLEKCTAIIQRLPADAPLEGFAMVMQMILVDKKEEVALVLFNATLNILYDWAEENQFRLT